VYDSVLLDQPVEIIGFPEISLRASADAKLANWIVRLEDVQPDGAVTLITGAGQSGAQRNSAEQPEYLVPGKVCTLRFKLHFTTWTFQPGHRIRIAVTNAQYPSFWPTPYRMTTQLHVGDPDTWIKLPVIPYEKRPTPVHYPPIPYEEASDAETHSGGGDPVYWVVARDPKTGVVSWEQKTERYYRVRGAELYRMDYRLHETNERNPAQTSFRGQSEGQVKLKGRTVMHRTILDVRSAVDSFHVLITRRIYENGRLVRERVFDEVVPRDHQ
jgi:hypothetical protein